MPEHDHVIPRYRVGAIVVVVATTVLVVDQVSKNLAIDRYVHNPPRTLGPFHIHLVANRGALMGLPLPTWVLFMVVALLVVVAVSGLTKPTSRAVVVGYALLMGGAAGNIADRLQHRGRFPDHAVVDWVASNALPTFNLADLAIAGGLLILVVTSGRAESRSREDPVPAFGAMMRSGEDQDQTDPISRRPMADGVA